MFLYVLETKVNHSSENTLLDGAANGKEKHNTKQSRRNKGESMGACIILPESTTLIEPSLLCRVR